MQSIASLFGEINYDCGIKDNINDNCEISSNLLKDTYN